MSLGFNLLKLTFRVTAASEQFIGDIECCQDGYLGSWETGRPVGDFSHGAIDVFGHPGHIFRVCILTPP